MIKCKQCGSYAINPHLHGRKIGDSLDLCDVCYWRQKFENLRNKVKKQIEILNRAVCSRTKTNNIK